MKEEKSENFIPGLFAGIVATIIALGWLSSSYGSTASEVCRVLAKEPDNLKIYWDKDQKACVRDQPAVKIEVGVP